MCVGDSAPQCCPFILQRPICVSVRSRYLYCENDPLPAVTWGRGHLYSWGRGQNKVGGSGLGAGPTTTPCGTREVLSHVKPSLSPGEIRVIMPTPWVGARLGRKTVQSCSCRTQPRLPLASQGDFRYMPGTPSTPVLRTPGCKIKFR